MEKTVLITGASKGIGKEMAYVFAKQGYSLLLTARNEAELSQLQTELKTKYHCNAKFLAIDLSQPKSVDLIIDTFQNELSQLDILVNNAGFGIAKKFTDTMMTDVSGMIEVNINALTLLTYRILPYMVARKKGQILNVASTAAFAPGPYMAVYYATKAYVLSFSQAIREEYHPDGIIVSTLCPGPTQTPFVQRAGLENTYLFNSGFPVMSAKQVAEIAYKGLMKQKNVIVPGIINKSLIYSMLFTPTWLVTKITSKLGKPRE